MTQPEAYYNEIEPFCVEWLRNLIAAGVIAPGVVDDRSIEDVKPDDLRNFTQCHFFAGAGIWSYALRACGWPDSRPVWTGSCPCQPFSASGKGLGFSDERHLWPSFSWLIQQCRPPKILGEQVASKDTDNWFDLVQTDLEAMGYAFGLTPFPSAGIGAPHIRDRAYWMGDYHGAGLEGLGSRYQTARRQPGEVRPIATASEFGRLVDAYHSHGGAWGRGAGEAHSGTTGHGQNFFIPGQSGGANIDVHGLANTYSGNPEQFTGERTGSGTPQAYRPSDIAIGRSQLPEGQPAAGPVNGFWADADWLFCRDGKWRPVEPGTFPLVNGDPTRVGRLRAYGNALNAEAAKEFIKIAMEYRP